ncbi:MAG: phosphatidate cytidylyltransferase [Cellvibrionales bacterium TMED47]|jgi:phosphatidate cytidylyltransferase|nr:phosphatidate cytidylyltransferase [Porticoccaceae bacterium]RPG84093.1 MAG: phosphatidate cytidylyltransferase [Cellvibrionales bacterium TMED47]|tara:strand:- start:1713 stop:2540 length:828 start_codon:yes stop_codon:yes gene_type:complete
MFKQRFATASILALLFASALAFFSTPIFLIFIMMVALVAGWEWSDLSRIKSKFGKVLFLVGLFISLMLAANYLSILGQYDQLLGYQICFAAMVLWAVIFLWLQGYPSSAILWSSGSIMIVLGIALLTATWVALASIISLENGRFLLLLAVGIIVLADVGGYIVGKTFGRHKLAPTISPGKTWEGLFGGMALQGLLVLLLALIFTDINLLNLCLLVFPVAICSVIGDLFESMLKRQRGVKDSSNLLPGHGGFLDRLDGVMPALPMFFIIISKASPF